jgi:gas vesicle protein
MKTRIIVWTIFTIVLGGLLGTGVGFLFAPHSGRSTRAALRNKGAQIQEKVSEDINQAGAQVMNRVDDLAAEARGRVVEIGGQLKDSVSSISLPFPGRGK